MDNRKADDRREPEIVYSRSVKAGKRIYYLDVKKARNADLYVCITESKKRSMGEAEPPSFEKHKLFLYKEDFAHFVEGLEDVIGYVKEQLGDIEERVPFVPNDDQAVEQEKNETSDNKEQKAGLFGFFNRK
ncbi:MAG: DUF3276 family protein [Paludibacteraceae bacterium]|nr:DUF3276 family protein [Paludibacteraceae bacterium]